jgi:uncharacterized protein (UPF0335 family)
MRQELNQAETMANLASELKEYWKTTIAEELRNKGFDVKIADDCVIASLNRPVNTEEVEMALDFEVETARKNNSVMVRRN